VQQSKRKRREKINGYRAEFAACHNFVRQLSVNQFFGNGDQYQPGAQVEISVKFIFDKRKTCRYIEAIKLEFFEPVADFNQQCCVDDSGNQ